MALTLRWLWTAVLFAVCLEALSAQLPSNLQAGLQQVQTLIAARDFAQAESVLSSLAEAHRDSGEVRYRLGLVLLRRGEIEGASVYLEAAAQLTPDSPLVWLGVARVRLRKGDAGGATGAAERADALAPEHPAISRALAMFYAEAGDFARATSYEKRRFDADPQDAASALRLADYSLRAGDAETALAAAERAAALEDGGDARLLLGKAARAAGDPRRAVEEFQQAIALDPKQPTYYAELAQLFLDHRTAEPAAVVLERAVARFPEDVELLRLLGVTRYAAGEKLKAIDSFLRITEIEPDSEVGYASLETLLPDAGERIDEIVGRLRGFCERRPTAVGLYLLALALAFENPADREPPALLRRAIELDPDFWPAHFEFHKGLLAKEDYEAAAAALERTIELHPGYAPAHFALAQVYTRTGRRKQAAEERQVHHKLVREQREATASEREASPRLPFTILER